MKGNNQIRIVRYFNPTSDWGFKRLFGTEYNKDLLIGLLKRLIPDEGVEDVEYLNGELLLPFLESGNGIHIPDSGEGFTMKVRKSVIDVYCRCSDGKRILVEMQNYAGRPFLDRAIVYTAASIVESYNCSIQNKYEVRKTIFIAITGDNVFPEVKDAPVKLGLCNLDAKNTMQMSDRVLQIFVELPKFADNVGQLTPGSSFLDRFAVAMKQMASDRAQPEELKEELLSGMYRAADFKDLSETESENYISSIMTEYEYQATLIDYLKRGQAEGKVEGRAEGISEVAKNLKAAGQPLELIAQCTGLSIKEIERL